MTYHNISWHFVLKIKKHHLCRESAQLRHFCLFSKLYRDCVTMTRKFERKMLKGTQCLGPLCIWQSFSNVTYIWSEYSLVQKQFSFTYTWHIWSTIWQVPGRGNGQYGETVFVFDNVFVTIIAKGRNCKYGNNCKSFPSQVSQFRL